MLKFTKLPRVKLKFTKMHPIKLVMYLVKLWMTNAPLFRQKIWF